MNQTQLRVLLQYLATAASAYVAGRGWLPANDANEIFGALVPLICTVFAVWTSRNAGKIAAAAKVAGPDGKPVLIIAPDAIANALPAVNVVPASAHEVRMK